MRKRSFLLSLAAGLLACSFGTMNAMAGSVLNEDEGTYSFTITSEGGGKVSVAYSDVLLTTINEAPVPGGSIASTFDTANLTTNLTGAFGPFTTYSITEPNSAVKVFGTPGPSVISSVDLEDTQLTATAVVGFFNLNGTVVLGSPASEILQTTSTGTTEYDFSQFATPGDITLTYNKVGANFAALIAGPAGHSISGTGGFTELAIVPEPASMALLGIGMSCLFAFRRFVRSNYVA
jgi:hypothetical protein